MIEFTLPSVAASKDSSDLLLGSIVSAFFAIVMIVAALAAFPFASGSDNEGWLFLFLSVLFGVLGLGMGSISVLEFKKYCGLSKKMSPNMDDQELSDWDIVRLMKFVDSRGADETLKAHVKRVGVLRYSNLMELVQAIDSVPDCDLAHARQRSVASELGREGS